MNRCLSRAHLHFSTLFSFVFEQDRRLIFCAYHHQSSGSSYANTILMRIKIPDVRSSLRIVMHAIPSVHSIHIESQ